jgi:hypothetical protein
LKLKEKWWKYFNDSRYEREHGPGGGGGIILYNAISATISTNVIEGLGKNK